MRKNHDIAFIQSHPFAVLQTRGPAAFSKQVVDDHVPGSRHHIWGHSTGSRRPKAPGSRELSVVENSPVELHHFQYFGKYIHSEPRAGLPANRFGRRDNPNTSYTPAGKRTRRRDKWRPAYRRIVTASGG